MNNKDSGNLWQDIDLFHLYLIYTLLTIADASHLCPNEEKYQTDSYVNGCVVVKLFLSTITQALLQLI